MIKVASCGAIEFEEGDVASAVARCAERARVEFSLAAHDNPVDLVESCTKALHELPYDLVICAVDLAGMSGVSVISELNGLHHVADELRCVLCSESPAHAYDAHSLGVDGYLVEPISAADFDRVVGRILGEISQLHAASAVIRCRDRVRRVSFRRISYAETSGHDQVIHHIGSDVSCEMRGSSRSLFAILEGDGRFFKVGSSHIVNCDYVAQVDSKEGLAVLTDGVRIPVPVRNRKAFEQALLARAARLASG